MFLSELTGHIVWIQQAAACFLTNRNSVASKNHILSQGSQGTKDHSEGLKTYFHTKNQLETFGNHILLTRFHMLSNLQVAVGKSDTLMIPHWGNNVRKTDSTERTWSRKLSGHYFQLRNQAVSRCNEQWLTQDSLLNLGSSLGRVLNLLAQKRYMFSYEDIAFSVAPASTSSHSSGPSPHCVALAQNLIQTYSRCAKSMFLACMQYNNINMYICIYIYNYIYIYIKMHQNATSTKYWSRNVTFWQLSIVKRGAW